MPKRFNLEKLFLAYIVFISIAANIFFFLPLTFRSVGFGDAWSRMNIARRVVDSLTPGIAQLGGIWLPFPQLLIVPFVSIDLLYFSGIAGAFVSTPAFIIGGIYLYKSLLKLTKSKFIAFLGSVIYASNINLLYIQTSPMSEPLFICCVLGALYHFIKWQEDIKKNLISLILAGFWTFVATLTRYEGYMLLLVMTVCVIVISQLKTKIRRISEGNFFIFTTLAAFGIFLWLIYSWAIFGHPLNWYKIYTGQISVISTVKEKPLSTWGIENYRGNLEKSVSTVVESVLQMNGALFVFPVLLGLVFLIFFIQKSRKEKNLSVKLAAIFIASAPMLFLMLSSFRGTALVRGPVVNWQMFSNYLYHLNEEYNLRYGLLALPYLIVATSLVFSLNSLTKFLYFLFTVAQISVVFIGKPTTVYNFPLKYIYESEHADYSFVNRFREMYDGKLILVSAIANDQLIHSLKIPYKKYIYEGTRKYWLESVANPTKYASWILMKSGPKVVDTGGSSDFVSYYLQDSATLSDNYDLVYEDSKARLYKIKEN